MYSLKELYRIGKGPSSSHTIGPERACKLFLDKYPQADSFVVRLKHHSDLYLTFAVLAELYRDTFTDPTKYDRTILYFLTAESLSCYH